ncbi:MAG: Gfo/Idh/MocA family oxidoreductase [Capsulimonadales bacterium]|nr:Gfo/Idh/MocA family oxidoreductase [Capsulimonadales bacterium]
MAMNRRRFLEVSSAAGATLLLPGSGRTANVQAANEKLNIGVIGVAHQGEYNLNSVATENIVALCDIDENYLAAAKARFPQAATYHDYRRMLERKDLDAVVIATPDHTHASATLAALETGRHVYCEKPLTHTVAEARKVTELARRQKRVTQMGTQIHAGNNYRRVVELIQSGAIGAVTETHHWVGRVWRGAEIRGDAPPVPSHLHWDLWLGPQPFRPYRSEYVPANWRGYWAFGGGTMADMGCHHMDLAYWALGLGQPLTISAEGPPVHPDLAPEWITARFTYPARGKQPPVTLTWYHGEKRPPQFAEGKLPKWGDGSLFVGEKGMLLADYGRYVLLPEKDFAGFVPPDRTIPDSIGHHAEWINAIKTNGTTTCRFDYSAVLTEAVLLGTVAYRAGKMLEWDAAKLKFKNAPEAEGLLHPVYREKW